MYQGYLFKLGGDVFPVKYIIASTYKVSPNKRQDLNSTRTATGVLDRHVLNHMPSTVEFQISGDNDTLNDVSLEACMSFIRSHYTVAKERKVKATFFCPDTNDYKTEDMYMPDIDFPIYKADESHVYYDDVTLKFIGY